METPHDQFEEAVSQATMIGEKRQRAIAAHTEIRKLLEADPRLKEWVIDTILIGSYARETGRYLGEDVDVFLRIKALSIFADPIEGDVADVAATLRRSLGASIADITEGLGGAVVCCSEGAYDLSAFLDAAKRRHAKLLGLVANSAQAWKHIAQQQQVEKEEALRCACRTISLNPLKK